MPAQPRPAPRRRWTTWLPVILALTLAWTATTPAWAKVAKVEVVEDDLDLCPPPSPDERPSPTQGSLDACIAQLREMGVVFKELTPIHTKRGCKAERPLEVTHIAPGVRFKPAAILNCPVTRALATWTNQIVMPAAQRVLHQPLVGIQVAASYVCRPVNGNPKAKLSEHSRANAIDIQALEVAGFGAIPIKSRKKGKPLAVFQRAIRQKACQYFTTVLGPGADKPHGNHLHLDLRSLQNDCVVCR